MRSAELTGDLVTVEEFEEFADHLSGRNRCELVDGRIRVMAPAGGWHGKISMDLGSRIHLFAKQNRLGLAFAAETGFRLSDPADPDAAPSVRAPDACFISAHRTDDALGRGYIAIAPDLAVEVHSPSDRVGEVADKARWWLARGVREVWNVDPASETITILQPDGSARLFHRGEVAASPKVLPGFKVDLADLFVG